jgi:hypothetical protein
MTTCSFSIGYVASWPKSCVAVFVESLLGGIAQMFCVIQSTARVTDMSTWDIRCRIQPTCVPIETKYLDGVDGAALLTFLHLYLQPTSVSFFLSLGAGGGGDGGNGRRKFMRLAFFS